MKESVSSRPWSVLPFVLVLKRAARLLTRAWREQQTIDVPGNSPRGELPCPVAAPQLPGRDRLGSTMRSALLVVLLSTPAAQPGSSAPPPPDFEREIRPLLESACLACHSGAVVQADLRMDSREALLRGGNELLVTVRPEEPGTLDSVGNRLEILGDTRVHLVDFVRRGGSEAG